MDDCLRRVTRTILYDIPGMERVIRAEGIDKGLSGEEKLFIETEAGDKLLLRISERTEYDKKQTEFDAMRRAAALGVPMSRPLYVGLCQAGQKVCSLLSWCEGVDAEEKLPKLSSDKQYRLGFDAGRHLNTLHTLPAPAGSENWALRFGRKTDRRITAYKACGITFDGDQMILQYLEKNRSLLLDRPQTFQHGDYHIGNMIISPDDTLQIIDFNRFDFGDPWEESNRIVWSAAVSPAFASGQIHGYFNGEPPDAFFPLLAFYTASNAVSSTP